MRISLEKAMAITAPKEERTSSTAEVKYLKLKDGDSLKVRFIFDNLEGFSVYPVHQYDRFRKVMCLREPAGGSYSDCPLCEAASEDNGFFQMNRVFVPLYVEETGEVLIWERSLVYFMREIVSILQDPDVVTGKQVFSTLFKITRRGAGFNDTSYIISNLNTDDKVIPEDLEVPDASIYIAKRTYEELKDFLRTGQMPTRGGDTEGYGTKEEERVSARSLTSKKKEQTYAVDDDEIPF